MTSVGDKDRVLELTRRFLAPHRVEVWDDFGTIDPSADAALEGLEEALVRVKDVDRPVPQRNRMTSQTRP
jgi:hypothetical protein